MVSLLPRPTEMDEDRTASLSPFFIIAVFCRHTHRTAATRPPVRRLRANRTLQLIWVRVSRDWGPPPCFFIPSFFV
ncbi:hypothetical protein TCDM_10981 [Trypanosoma cruzi Dm28c]|uniref:Uncharacterized protein n=1 Tax=Trypanosoma cruzi Dm28c TaxID=1416333 RepID=V5D1T8_TRYCR|nr:hypothetical protein TCDM_10981 [Trypanosoma cruzi Dm28c]